MKQKEISFISGVLSAADIVKAHGKADIYQEIICANGIDENLLNNKAVIKHLGHEYTQGHIDYIRSAQF